MIDTVRTPPDMPPRMKQLQRDKVGRPIPWFVPEVNGEYDFRFTDMEKIVLAIQQELCFICGQKLNRVKNSHAPSCLLYTSPSPRD